MKKFALILCLMLLMLLPTLACAVDENVVVPLPTAVATVAPLQAEAEPDYTSAGMAGYYAQGSADDGSYQYPALTTEEKERALAQLAAYDAGERPKESALNLPANVVLSVYGLQPENYEGECAFVLLPGRALTDAELLQVVDAYAQLGLRFDPDGLTYRNCMRGGGVEASRFWTDEERQRYEALIELYEKQGLRPESDFDPLPGNGGMGLVELNENEYNGLPGFRFYPFRRMEDEELLERIHYDRQGSKVDVSSIPAYEQTAYQEARRLLGMPLASECNNRADYGDGTYGLRFSGAGGRTDENWSVRLDTATLQAVSGEYSCTDNATVYSDLHLDPFDERWLAIARQWVESRRTDGVTVARVESQGETGVQGGANYAITGYGVLIAVTMSDGSYYSLKIAYQKRCHYHRWL